MSDLSELTIKLLKFRRDRDWEKFHTPKDMALSLVLESSEVLEHFQWKSEEDVKEYVRDHKDGIGEELADVLNWVLLMAHDLDIDIIDALDKKIDENAKRYPIEKAMGSSKKYTEL